ncbi:MAG: lysine--tRNA ligase, partial [Dermacoccus nishinomiyaensis]
RLPADHRTGERVSVTGRVRALRDFGGVSFVVLDEDGARLQAMATRDVTPAEKYEHWRHWIDLGDIVSVTGEIVTSKHAELSVHVSDWQMAAKCLSPIPDLHSPFRDPDARVRNRSLDLIVNRDSMDMLLRRSRGVRAFRDAFDALGYTEVETPMLQAVHGGASARPFKTHINAYGMDLFMRIAPELYLKRLAVGGMQKVFELNRNFRNEGADATHNPEFTSLEAYDAYGDYLTMRDLTREVLLAVARAVNGGEFAERPQPDGTIERVDLSGQWPTIPVHEAVSRACGVLLTSASSRDEVAAVCAAHGVDAPREKSAGELVVELYDELVEGQTMFPTFYIDFPVETSPLTRAHRGDPRLSERWDLVAFGAEIGTAYSELVDPIEQRKRLTEQSLKAAAGDVEAMSLDEAFLSALEYAMPPTGGLGIGVDRSIMMMLGAPIRATLAFPFVRPQG